MPQTPVQLDFALCDRAPVHPMQAIQPHGVLLAIDAGLSRIVQLAGPAERVFGRPAGQLPGLALADVVGADAEDWLAAAGLRGAGQQGYAGAWSAPAGGSGDWDVTAHRRNDHVILEFEPAASPSRSTPAAMARLGRAVDALEAPHDLAGLLAAAAGEMRHLSAFDRVAICRLLPDGTVVVVADDKVSGLPSLLHRRFRVPDVSGQQPSQSPCDRLCIVPDTAYLPAPLVPAMLPGTGASLDLGDCVLRSVPATHLRHLRNMGVAAAMSTPVRVGQTVWGLVIGHHRSPHPLSWDVREACRHLAQVLSLRIEAREDAGHRRQAARLGAARERLLAGIGSKLASGAAVAVDAAMLGAIVPADGVAVLCQGRIDRTGHAPSEAQLCELVDWLELAPQGEVHATGRLVDDFPRAGAFTGGAGALLAMRVDGDEPMVALWFRDAAKTGRRQLPVSSAPDTIGDTSRVWSSAEVDTVRQLRRALGELHQQRALQDLNARLRSALAEQESLVAQKDVLMQEVHHRVQNSLQIVNAMLQLQARRAQDPAVRAQIGSAVHRLMAISSVHQHLWRSSDMQTVQLDRYLEQLCADLVASWGEGWAGQITLSACKGAVASNTAVTLALIVTELLTNAVKYAYDGAPGPIGIAVGALDGAMLQITVSDRGGGMQQEVKGTGLGSELIRIFTGQLGGSVEISSDRNGTTVSIRVPLALKTAESANTPGAGATPA
jgi:two-component system, chemotaxis family, sensor kinase Cph1